MRNLMPGVLAAACLVAAPGATFAFQATPAPAVATADMGVTEGERASFQRGLVAGGGPMIAAIIKRYPSEYRAFETSLIADFKAGQLTQAAAKMRAAEFFGLLGDRVMVEVRRAPDTDLRRLVAAQVAALRKFSAINPRACQEFGEDGQLTPETAIAASSELNGIMSDYVGVQLSVADAGAKAKLRRDDFSGADMDAVLKEYLRRGGSQAWVDASGSGDFSDLTLSDRCAASIVFLDAVLAQPDPVVARFMAAD